MFNNLFIMPKYLLWHNQNYNFVEDDTSSMRPFFLLQRRHWIGNDENSFCFRPQKTFWLVGKHNCELQNLKQ